MVQSCYCMQAKIEHAHLFYLGIDDFGCLGISNHRFLWFVDESKYNAIYSSVPSCADFKGLLFVNKAGLILDQRVFILGFYCWSKVCPVENMSHRKHVPSKICPIENMSVENISVEKSPGAHPLCVLLPK